MFLSLCRELLKPDTGKLLIAVVLPFRPFVEDGACGSKGKRKGSRLSDMCFIVVAGRGLSHSQSGTRRRQAEGPARGCADPAPERLVREEPLRALVGRVEAPR